MLLFAPAGCGREGTSNVPPDAMTDAPDSNLAMDVRTERPDATHDDAQTECEPLPGSAQFTAYCDAVSVAIITSTSDEARVQIAGYVYFADIPSEACTRVDRVEVLEHHGDPMPIVAVTPERSGQVWLAMTDAPADLLARCGSEMDRTNALAFRLVGRTDGGSFEARCGGGMGATWPPTNYLTCNQNLPSAPIYATAYVMSTTTPYGSTVTSQLGLVFPESFEWTVDSIDSTVQIVPDHGLVAPFDSTWDTSFYAGDSVLSAMINLESDEDPLGEELCPAEVKGPDGFPTAPLFFVRVTGVTAGLPFTAEAFTSQPCSRN